MSLYKIDGFVLSVDELYTWIAGFVSLYRRGRLNKRKIPKRINDIMKKEKEDRIATQEVLEFLEQNQSQMTDFIRMTKQATADLAIEKKTEKTRKDRVFRRKSKTYGKSDFKSQ